MADAEGAGLEAAGDPARFSEAYRALRADTSIQFEMAPFEPPQVPGWVRWLAELFEGTGPLFKTIFWVAAGAAALAILYWIFRWIEGGGVEFLKRRRAQDAAEPDWRPEEAPARALLSEADQLAAQGRFGDAAHLLLFRSIEDIDRKRPAVVRPALTSRDIASAPQLPPGPRSAFSRIVMTVERSLFGGRTLGEQDWRSCRTAYEEFAFAPEWKA